MILSVTYQGNDTGTLQIERQGLYYHLDADCGISPTKPLRLYAVNGFAIRSIGVIGRDGSLHRRLSAREAKPLPQTAVLGLESGGFLPWCGEVDGETVRDGYLRKDGPDVLLALPVTDGGEVPLIAYAAQMQPQTVDGRACLVLTLQDGKPLPVPEPVWEESAAEKVQEAGELLSEDALQSAEQ